MIYLTADSRLRSKKTEQNGTNYTIIEEKIWEMASSLRGTMNAAEYKHVFLGLVFLKYTSDAFEEHRIQLDSIQNVDPGDPDEYQRHNIFWVPTEGRWSNIVAQSRQSAIGSIIDGAMMAIERGNPAIKNAFPKNYARISLDKTRLGQIIDLISNIRVADAESGSKDVLGRVYEYFLSRFAHTEGKRGGEFYTPRSVARLLVAMLQPCRGRVYDPCCGSSGMLVQCMEFVRDNNDNGGKVTTEISIYGQESDYTTWQLAKMNLAIRGMDSGQIAHGDSFHNDQHPDLKADFILAGPPFNLPEWGGERLQEDQRWVYGVPPKENANFAWVQHMVYHLSPSGMAGLVLANGSMSSNKSGEGEIRKNLLEADLVDCVVALPGQLFHSTQIPACLWFLSRGRARTGEVLLIDARSMGCMIDRSHRELGNEDITRISNTYRVWRDEKKAGQYDDVAGFCKNVTLGEIRRHDYTLTPGRYMGVEQEPADVESFEEKMKRLVLQWSELQSQSKKLDTVIAKNMKSLGFM